MGVNSGGSWNSGGQKGTKLPNPNYGSGSGVDNSNGVYNAGQSAQAAAQGSQPLPTGGLTDANNNAAGAGNTGTNTTATTASAQVQPYTGTQKGTSGNKAGQPPASGYGAGMTAEQALAVNPQPASYSSYDGQDHTTVPPPAATAPPTTTAAPGMQGSAIANYAQSKMQSKGMQPPQMAQGQGGMITGTANALNPANAAAPAQLPTNTGNPWVDMANRRKNDQASYAGAPDWMKNVLAGQDMFGGTNESRAKYETDNNLGARSNAGENTYEHGGSDQNWQGWATKVSGESDPWEAMRKIAAMARNSPKGIGAMADVRRSMEASGIDPGIAARVHEMFATTGGDAESAARRLGVLDEYNRRGGMYMTARNYDPTKYAGATIAGKAPKNTANLWTTGTPESGKPPPGPDNVVEGGQTSTAESGNAGKELGSPTDLGPGVEAGTGGTATLGQNTPNKRTTSPGNDALTKIVQSPQVAQIAKQYGVTPEIAAQIYQQILQQSQSSGGQ